MRLIACSYVTRMIILTNIAQTMEINYSSMKFLEWKRIKSILIKTVAIGTILLFVKISILLVVKILFSLSSQRKLIWLLKLAMFYCSVWLYNLISLSWFHHLARISNSRLTQFFTFNNANFIRTILYLFRFAISVARKQRKTRWTDSA